MNKLHTYELGNNDFCMSIVENNKMIITVCLSMPGTVLDYAYFPGIIINGPSFYSKRSQFGLMNVYGHPH